MVLPAAPRQALRASGAPAAREIFCANAEARDAPGLAAVMQFQDNSSTKMAAGGARLGTVHATGSASTSIAVLDQRALPTTTDVPDQEAR